MENGWEMKCGLKWVCSSSNSSVPLSSEQFQHQEARNQMNKNVHHCVLNEAPESLPPYLKKASPTSKILTFGSCKQNNPETTSSFHSILSVSPSLLQFDFERQSNAHIFSGGCRSDTCSQGNLGAIPNWPSMQNNANFNTRVGVDVSPSFLSKSNKDTETGRSHSLSNDLDDLRSLISHGGSKNGIARSSSLQNGVAFAPSSISSVSEKQNSVDNKCPRVFCLGACGDLLISSTGLFGILCLCHGMRMSVSKFCEHAGLTDVNPGYAVRMDSGESIAQWRKEYLQKFGIRAQADHRGWDWSEGFIANSGSGNSSTPVVDKTKVFDLSSLFNSSTESIKFNQSSQKYSNQTLKDAQRENGHDDFNTGSSRMISKPITDYSSIACPPLRSFTPSLIGKEGSFYKMNSHENSYSSGCQKLPSFSFKSQNNNNNNKDDNFERHKISSSIELKLGHSWGSESTIGDQTTITLEKATHNLTNTNVTDHSKRSIFCHSIPDFNRTKEPFQAGLLNKGPISFHVGPFNNAPTSFRGGPLNNVQSFANGTTREEYLKAGLQNNLAISMPSSSTNISPKGNFYNKENSKRITNSHPLSLLRLQNEPCVDRSVLLDFAHNNGDAPITNINFNNLASQNNKSANMDATCGRKDSMIGNLTSSKGYAKEIESSGLTRNGIFNPNKNLLLASKSCNKTPSIGFSPLSSVLVPHCGPVTCSKNVRAINSHMSVESSRLLALRNVEKSLKEKHIDGSTVFNEPSRIHSDERQEKAQKSFLDQGSLRRQRPSFAVGHVITSSFLPDVGHKKGITEEIKLQPELTEKYNSDPCHPKPKQRSLLSGQENIECVCNMAQRFYGGPCSHFSGRCQNNVQTICSKKKARLNLAEKETSLACNQKGKSHVLTLDSTNSQCLDAPSETNSLPIMRCSDFLTLLPSSREESIAKLKDMSPKCTPRLKQETELFKEREFSDISSDCSLQVVTQASNEVNVIDQGSAISISCSSVEAVDSIRNSQLVCGDNTISIEEESLTLSNNIAHRDVIDACKETRSKSNELNDFRVTNSGSGEMINEDKNENEFKPRKRKRTTKWKMLEASITIADVSQFPSKSRVCAGSTPSHHASTCEDDQILLEPSQNSSRMVTVNSSNDSLKLQKSDIFSVKMLSRKRDLNEFHNCVGVEHGNQKQFKGNDDFINTPESDFVKEVKHDETIKRQIKTTEVAKEFWLENRISDLTFRKVKKPIACGDYGIICHQESDIDIIKPPKIVPLSQVLKASKRLSKCKKKHVVSSKRKKKNLKSGRKSIDSSCNFSQTKGSIYYKVQSGYLRAIDDCNLESPHVNLDHIHINNPSESKDVGLDGERNLNASTCQIDDLSKTREVRMRSLYELSMKGNKFISADTSRSQNVMGVDPTVFESTRTSDCVKRDGGEIRDSARRSSRKKNCGSLVSKMDELCCVCGISDKDEDNWLLECGHCSIRIHQACYGVSRAPKGEWYCRPCRTSSKDVACVLCGYDGGAMTRAFGSRNVVKSLLKAWDIRTEPHIMSMASTEALYVPAKMEIRNESESARYELGPSVKPVVHNSIVSGLFDPTVKQWVHMVCGLWTPGTRCPSVDTMSAFDVSGVSHLREYVVCYICKRAGGSCIKCRVEMCSTQFHPWCAHQKGLLQSEVEGVDNDKVGFYGRCLLHVESEPCPLKNDDPYKHDNKTECEDELTCARTKGYQGRKQGHGGNYSSYQHCGKSGHLVSQVQLDAWHYINTHKLKMNSHLKPPVADVDQDYRKEYARYKQGNGWKHLVVYKSGIHALGLYTSQFIQRGAMVVEYIGEIVGPRVADKRENEYLSGKKLQYKSACYFFRIDKEQIIDATCKGGIARFVNHSCQPNCVAKVLTIRGEKKVVFLAQRDINPGEEITYDYHFNHEDEGKKIPCFCNSKNCRRYLN